MRSAIHIHIGLKILIHFISRCLKFMSNETNAVIQDEDFLTLSMDALCMFLSLDNMQTNNEMLLYRAAVKWVQSQGTSENTTLTDTEVRDALHRALCMIRFPVVDLDDFSSECGNAGVLTAEEKADIFQYIISHRALQAKSASMAERETVAGFSTVPRVLVNQPPIMLNKVKRFQKTCFTGWRCNPTKTDAIKVSPSSPIWLAGVGIHSTRSAEPIRSVKVQLLNRNGKELRSIFARNQSAKINQIIPLLWDVAVKLEAGEEYRVLANIDSPKPNYTYKGEAGSQWVSEAGVTFTFMDTPLSTNGTKVRCGQIPELLFYKENPI